MSLNKQPQNLEVDQFAFKDETPCSRKQRMNKNRAIRKCKMSDHKLSSWVEKKSEMKEITKQEKQEIQKVRNRQAAQRSREIHKQYVENIQRQNQQLKQQISSMTFICSRCKAAISPLQEDSSTNQSNCKFQQSKSDFLIMKDQDQELADPENSRIQDFLNEENNFKRFNQNDSSSPFGLFFFILAIACATLFIMNSSMPLQQQTISSNNRVLLEEKLQHRDEAQIAMEFTMGDTEIYKDKSIKFAKEIHQSTTGEIVPLNYKFSLFDKEQCITSILQEKHKKEEEGRIARYVNNLRERSRSQDGSEESNIIFCQMPKIFRKNNQNVDLFSNIINVVISGSEMMEIVNKEPLYMNKIFEFDGIYQINAQVLGITRLEDNSCLAH